MSISLFCWWSDAALSYLTGMIYPLHWSTSTSSRWRTTSQTQQTSPMFKCELSCDTWIQIGNWLNILRRRCWKRRGWQSTLLLLRGVANVQQHAQIKAIWEVTTRRQILNWLILHAADATRCGATNINIYSPDTDVFILALPRYTTLCKDTMFVTRTGKNDRVIQLGPIYAALGITKQRHNQACTISEWMTTQAVLLAKENWVSGKCSNVRMRRLLRLKRNSSARCIFRKHPYRESLNTRPLCWLHHDTTACPVISCPCDNVSWLTACDESDEDDDYSDDEDS